MRVVFVNRIAWPDEGATAIYLTDVAGACAASGHQVHVICGDASYRRTSSGGALPRRHAGVCYHRISGRRGEAIVDRSLASLEFLARAAWRLLRVPRPDVVIALTDPPFLDAALGFVARLRGARTVHWLMDVYPDIAVAAGILHSGGFPERALGGLMGRALRRADFVVVLGRAMRRPVLARGVSRLRLRVIENWAPREVEEAAGRPAPSRPDRPFTLMYSGNYGRAHDLDPLIEALRRLPPGTKTRLLLCVSGTRASELADRIRGLPVAVEIRPPAPRERLVETLREGDLHVVSVREGYEHLLVPSKMYAPLRLGIPILVLGPPTSEPARHIARHADGLHFWGGVLPTSVPNTLRACRSRTAPDTWVTLLARLARVSRTHENET